MAVTLVADITTNGKALIASTLPAAYAALDYEHEIEKNAFENNATRYGFISLGAPTLLPAERTNRNVTVDHTFQLILTTDFRNHDDDTAQVTAKNELFQRTHELMQVFINKKANTAGVLIVRGLNIEDPEFLDDNTVIALRTNLSVLYRYATM